MTLIDNKSDYPKTKPLQIIMNEIKLGIFIYSGCLTGEYFIPYFLDLNFKLEPLGSVAFKYMIGCFLVTSISIGIRLFIRSKTNQDN